MTEIVRFSGINLKHPGLAALIDSSLDLAHSLQQKTGGGGQIVLQVGASRLALMAAMSASSALLALAGGTCNLGNKPADIGVTVDDSGDLILRCGHSPPHEWSYERGKKL